MFSFNWRYEEEFLLIWIQLTGTFKSIETFFNCCQGPVHYERNTLRLAYLLINTTGYSLGFIQHFGAEPYPQSTRWWTSNRDLAREIFLCCWGGWNQHLTFSSSEIISVDAAEMRRIINHCHILSRAQSKWSLLQSKLRIISIFPPIHFIINIIDHVKDQLSIKFLKIAASNC